MKKKTTKKGRSYYDIMIYQRPEYRYEVVGKPDWLSRLSGSPGAWQITEIKKVKNNVSSK